MSWESTVSYYQIINESVKKRLGGLHSAKILLYSVNFDEIETLQHKGEWEKTGDILSKAAQNLEQGGAEFMLICTNTMHKVAPQIEKNINIPILHIADATGNILKNDNKKTVGLLGTAFTMEQDFYKGRLKEKFGLDVTIPNDEERAKIHEIIYNELCLGQIKEASKKYYLNVIERLKTEGTEAVILGCTEIALLVGKEKTSIPMFDTTRIHAEEAVSFALGD